jgi:hypothetical protein
MTALMADAETSGAAMPLYKEVTPPNCVAMLQMEVLEAADVCILTLMVSKGCPTMTEADPATPPAIKS